MDTQDPNEALAAEEPETYDKHRFSSEPKPRGNKFVVVVLMLFALFIIAIGIVVLIGKKQVNAYMVQRAENAKANATAEPEATRKTRSFAALSTESAPLPESFGSKAKPTEENRSSSSAIPVIPKGSSTTAMTTPAIHADGTHAIVPAPLDMMMEREVKQSNDSGTAITTTTNTTSLASGGSTTAAPGATAQGKPQAETVQEFAREQAQKTPITSTAQASAAKLGNRSYLLARGAYVPCTLETQLISNIAGPASCVLSQNIYSDDGKVVLMEKATHILGEYKSSLKSGDSRIAVLWTRIKTPMGVVIDVDSPAADSVGSAGVDGYVDNHWAERIGAAFLLSLVDDVVALEIAKQSEGTASTATPQKTIAISKSTSEKVLESTINIPPTLYKNRGERIMVFVNRDLWFDSVYNVSKK